MAQVAAAENKAIRRMIEMLDELEAINAEFPWLLSSFTEDIARLAEDKPKTGDVETEEGTSDSETRLTNSDQITVFFLERLNAPATPNEIQTATGIPLSSVKNIFYVKAAKDRFVKEEGDGRVRWRLADPNSERTRLHSRD